MNASIKTGFDDLDEILNGLYSPSLIVVASRPAMGKTSFALNIVEHVAIKQNVSCAIFAYEDQKKMIVRRMLCSHAGVDSLNFQQGLLSKCDIVKLERSVKDISKAPIFLDDSPSTISDIEERALRLQRECGLGFVVIDINELNYMQFAGVGKGYEDVMNDQLQFLVMRKRIKDRARELSEISNSLKHLVKKLCVPVMVLCRLGRSPERRNDNRPRLSDMRYLGALGQNADVILFVYRDWLYHLGSEDRNKIEIIVGKNKNGRLGNVELSFQEETARIGNLKPLRP